MGVALPASVLREHLGRGVVVTHRAPDRRPGYSPVLVVHVDDELTSHLPVAERHDPRAIRASITTSRWIDAMISFPE
jgi:hypothetical protein